MGDKMPFLELVKPPFSPTAQPVDIKIKKTAKIWKCSLCTKTFSGSRYLNMHMVLHSGIKAFECPICEKKFALKPNLKIHQATHSTERPCECSTCGKRFANTRYLRLHKETHKEVRPEHECPMCRKIYINKSHYNRHLRAHSTEPFGCSICGITFSFKELRKEHMLTHRSPDERVECSSCRKEFPHKRRLRAHMVIHESDRDRFECSVCGKWLLTESYIKHHVRAHHGDKPFGCSTCGKNFLFAAGLKAHMVTHKQVKASGFPAHSKPCSGSGLSQGPDLRVRVLARPGPSEAVDPAIGVNSASSALPLHRCHICCEGFLFRPSLFKHSEGHRADSSFSCEACKCGFSSNAIARKHSRAYHTTHKLV